ncbi:MAG: hypothetical protein Q8S00_20930 [Deltaproteobacteria bacterium]|nr:hypothetical protein [Deltaproteobacteria bacterium]
MNDQILRNHLQEMSEKNHSVYQLFDSLENAELDIDSISTLRQEAAQVVDLVLLNGLNAGPAIRQTGDAIVRMGMPMAHNALLAWRSAIAGAYPSRRGMHTILHNFRQWLDGIDPVAQTSFLEALPKLAPAISQLGTNGVQKIIEAIKSSKTVDECQMMLTYVSAYGFTSAPTVLGMCQLAQRAIQWGRTDYLTSLATIVPPERTGESSDAKKLIPALAQLSEACAERGEATWCRALDLILTLAEKSYSSSYVTAQKLPRHLQTCSPDAAVAYLEDFCALAKAVGIRIVGFGLGRLPTFYKKYGLERTRTFIHRAVLATKSYGVTAGQWFYEMKTAAARQMLNG